MIEVRNLTKRFGPTMALKGISFKVERGEVLGFLGPNGAGKTTAMRILTCYMPPDSGTASVASYDILDDPLEVKRRIGYLPENAPLYTDMEVIEYLGYVAEIRGFSAADRPKLIARMVETCGLKKALGKDIGELSKGYRQRVGLAQALIHDPDILILDEPTSGLDPSQIIEIRELIKGIGRQKTVILSTHILPEVEATCSRVLIINDGEIVADGPPAELASGAGIGERAIYVSIRAPLEEVESKLRSWDKIKGFSVLGSDGGGMNHLSVRVFDGDGMGEELFSFVVRNCWSLSELRAERASLEDVFLRLTTKETGSEKHSGDLQAGAP